MLKALQDILKHLPDNRRNVYPEPAAGEIYNENFFHDLFTSPDKIEMLFRLRPLKKTDTVLDMACGRGELVLEAVKAGAARAVGIDFAEKGLEIARRKADEAGLTLKTEFLRGDVTRMEFESNSFDAVFMADIVEHLSAENLRKSFEEAKRVLKPGGHLVIHTEPSVLYKKFGQYFVRDFFALKKKEWMTLTILEESRMGHVNIQSAGSLRKALSEVFGSAPYVSCSPANSGGGLKKIVALLNLWPVFSPHLWAVAQK